MEAPLAHLFLSAPSRGQSPKEAERGGVTEGAVIAVTTVTVVRQEAASGRGRSRQRRVGRDGHDGLALANRSRRDQVIPPAGLGVTRAVAAAAAACRVAVDDEAFSGEVPVNFCSAAAAASHSAPFRFGRVPPRVRRSQTGAAVRRMMLLRFGVLSEDETPEAWYAREV